MIFKNSVIYFLSSTIGKASPFLLLPILTNILSPVEYGTLMLFLSINIFSSALIGLALHSIVTKMYFEIEKSLLANYIGIILIIIIASALFWLLIITLLFYEDRSIYDIDRIYFYILPILAVLQTLHQLYLSVLRNEQKAIHFAIREISFSLIVFFTTVLILRYITVTWSAQIYGILVANIALGILALYSLKRRGYLVINIDPVLVKKILAFCIPLVPHLLFSAIILLTDRLMIASFLDVRSVAIYAIGYNFGMIVLLFTDAYIKSWSPWVYKSLNTQNFDVGLIVRSIYMYILILLSVAVICTYFSQSILPMLVSIEYIEAKNIVGLVAIGYCINGIYKAIFPIAIFHGRTKLIALVTMIAGTSNVVLNYLLIPVYGLDGAAYATILSYAISLVMILYFTNKFSTIRWNLMSSGGS